MFGFCDTKLSDRVGLGLHAISLDEARKSFQPTLWDDAGNVTQALFPGGHCDVGGGYVEHGLSDGPLRWFVDRLQRPDVGLRFAGEPPTAVVADACACGHAEWNKSMWQVLGAAPRSFRSDLIVDDSVRRRMAKELVSAEPPPEPLRKYAPTNLPA